MTEADLYALWLNHIQPWMKKEIDTELGPLEARIEWHVRSVIRERLETELRLAIQSAIKDGVYVGLHVAAKEQ